MLNKQKRHVLKSSLLQLHSLLTRPLALAHPRALKKKKMLTLSLLILLISPLLASITYVEGQTEIKTYTFLTVNPNPSGVGQQVQVTVWILPFNPYSRNGITNKDRFFNVTVQITAPDGTTTTQGPFFGDSNGNLWFNYTPKDVGNYTLKAIYPGGQLSPGQFLPSESQTTILVVQQDPIQYYSDNPLPTDYWTRPIDGQNRLWSSISGSWLMASYSLQYKTAAGVSVGAYNPYSQAPQAPHIMWTKEITTGGLVGGDQGANSYYSGPSYTSLFSPPIIMSGKLYYNTPEGFVCVELRTGQQLWETKDGKRLVCGQEWDTQKYSYTTAGIRSYLWTTSWEGI